MNQLYLGGSFNEHVGYLITFEDAAKELGVHLTTVTVIGNAEAGRLTLVTKQEEDRTYGAREWC